MTVLTVVVPSACNPANSNAVLTWALGTGVRVTLGDVDGSGKLALIVTPGALPGLARQAGLGFGPHPNGAMAGSRAGR